MKEKYFLGIDGGTGGMRVGIFNRFGKELAFASTEYPTIHQHSGWAEQKPADWWEALRESVAKALSIAKVTKEEIAALSYDVTCCSVLLCMNNGVPLRDSIIWMDVRASKEAEEIAQTNNPVLKFNSFGKVSAEWMPCKALWLKRNDPENYSQAEKVCEYADWLTYKLTGKWTANLSNIATRWYYDSQNGGFPRAFYQEIGLADVLDKFPQRITNLGDALGFLDPIAAEFLGLSEETIVGQGGVDAFIGILGLGVIEPGQVALITGSSHLIMGLTNDYHYEGKGVFGPFPDALKPGLGFVEGGQTSSGSILAWFRQNFCKDLDLTIKGAYEILNQKAALIPPGSQGLLVLDWWQGNRTPYTDSSVRGTVYGLSLNHTRAHVYRAIMEGVAFGTENVFSSFRKSGFAVNEIFMGGGTTHSDLWLQIHADVSNIPIKIPENPEAPTLGSAILAAVANGTYLSLEEAITNMVRYKKIIQPNFENHLRYRKIFNQYQKAYPEISSWMRETTTVLEEK